MKKFTILMILLFASTNSFAEWVYQTTGQFYTQYVNKSVTKIDDRVQIWYLRDFKVPQNIDEHIGLSTIGHTEFNCTDKTMKSLDMSVFEENMGKGRIVFSFDNYDNIVAKTSVQPNSFDDFLFNFSCNNVSNINNTNPITAIKPSSDWSVLSDNSEYTSYINYPSIRKDNNNVTMWTLIDYKTPQYSNDSEGNIKYSSMKLHYEIQCKQEIIKLLDYSANVGNSGYGDVVMLKNLSDESPIPITPSSRGESLYKIACSEKILPKNWTWVSETMDKKYTAYVDLKTIHKNGNKSKMWTLYDFNMPQRISNKLYLSVRDIREYDCHDKTMKELEFSYLSGNMGMGEIVYMDNSKDEVNSEITPESIGESFFNIACSKIKKTKK
jgi:hypothetical protein